MEGSSDKKHKKEKKEQKSKKKKKKRSSRSLDPFLFSKMYPSLFYISPSRSDSSGSDSDASNQFESVEVSVQGCIWGMNGFFSLK